MAQQPRESGAFPGLAIYGLLLELYPRTYLRRHRAELLQNFQDFQRGLPSRTSRWAFIAKDLAISLWSEHTRTFWGQTTIVFMILSLITAIAHLHHGKPEQLIRGLCFGYALGWFAGWFGRDWDMRSMSRSGGFVSSFRAQATMLACAILIVLATTKLFTDLQGHLVLAICYGVALAWVTGWFKNKRRMHL